MKLFEIREWEQWEWPFYVVTLGNRCRCVLVRDSIDLINTITKSIMKRQDFTSAHTPWLTEVREGTQGRDWSRSHGGMLLHGLFSLGFHRWLPHTIQGPPTSFINQEKVLQVCPQANLIGVFFSVKVPSSKMIIARVSQYSTQTWTRHSARN